MNEPAETTALPPGTVLGGRFHVRDLLGQGGMGAVYSAWDAQSGREVALKLLRGRFSADSRAQARFRREGELLARIRHPAIVAAYDTGALPDGTHFLVLELLHGETLAARIERDAPIPALALVSIVDQVCGALAAAHAHGLVHRDIKPSNIFLVRGASGPSVRLLDFGVAKPLDHERLTSTGVVVGTVLYMAPEQLAGEVVDARADVYSLGVVLHEALTGRHPFSAIDHEHLSTGILVGRASPIAGVSPAVAAVVNRAMARSRHERFPSAEALAAAFRDAVLAADTASHPAPATREMRASPFGPTLPATPRPMPQRKRSRSLAFLTVPLLLMCGVSGVGAVSCNACGEMIADNDIRELGARLRPAFSGSPKGAEYERDFAALERLHAEDRTSMWTVSLLKTELEDALEDGNLDEEELGFVMARVREAVERGGQYGFSRFWEIIGEDAERESDRERARQIEEDKRRSR